MGAQVHNICKLSATISPIKGWIIAWPELSNIKNRIVQEKLLYLAFEISPNRIGIYFDNGTMHWLSSSLYYQQSDTLDHLIYQFELGIGVEPLIGIGFSEHELAEKFMNAAEEYLMLILLSKNFTEY